MRFAFAVLGKVRPWTFEPSIRTGGIGEVEIKIAIRQQQARAQADTIDPDLSGAAQDDGLILRKRIEIADALPGQIIGGHAFAQCNVAGLTPKDGGIITEREKEGVAVYRDLADFPSGEHFFKQRESDAGWRNLIGLRVIELHVGEPFLGGESVPVGRIDVGRSHDADHLGEESGRIGQLFKRVTEFGHVDFDVWANDRSQHGQLCGELFRISGIWVNRNRVEQIKRAIRRQFGEILDRNRMRRSADQLNVDVVGFQRVMDCLDQFFVIIVAQAFWRLGNRTRDEIIAIIFVADFNRRYAGILLHGRNHEIGKGSSPFVRVDREAAIIERVDRVEIQYDINASRQRLANPTG